MFVWESTDELHITDVCISFKVNDLVFIHCSLRLIEKVAKVDYKEDTIKWTTDDDITAEQTESESGSDDDTENQ